MVLVRVGGVHDVAALTWAQGPAQLDEWRRAAGRPGVVLLIAEPTPQPGASSAPVAVGKAFLACADLAHPAGTAWLEMLSVEPGHRGRGVGTALLDAAEAEALRRGCRTLAGCVAADNGRARALYERRGFVAAGSWTDHVHYVDAGRTVCRDEPGVLLRKRLG